MILPKDPSEHCFDSNVFPRIPDSSINASSLPFKLLLEWPHGDPAATNKTGGNRHLARIAGLAGAPQVSGAGVDLLHKVGAHVEKGTPWYRIHAQFPADLGFARDLSERDNGYQITPVNGATP